MAPARPWSPEFCSAKWKARSPRPAPPTKSKRVSRHTHLLQGLRDFAFVTQLQLGEGQDRLHGLQFPVYVVNELGREALLYQGQILGHFEGQEEDDTHASGQGQLGNLRQARKQVG